jgi:hypothetical protein
MRFAPHRALTLLLLLGPDHAQTDGGRVWQADIRIRTFEVTKTRTSISARIVVYTEHDDEARDARLLILLPVGVGISQLPSQCHAAPGPSMVPALRAAVTCQMGAIPDRGFREVVVTTTLPADPLPRRFGAFTYSSTPDPVPGNNYAERTIP